MNILFAALVGASVSLPLGAVVYMAEKNPTRICCEQEPVKMNAQIPARVLYQIGPDGKPVAPVSHDELRALAVTL